jgi:predicted RNA-binding Zn-ribbon protein involved in translation (DUF1610 family)
MTSDPRHAERNRKWEHVHQCPQCAHIVKAEDIPRPAIISGVMTCPNCEWSGPINVQIVKGSPTENPKVKRVSRAGVVSSH